MGIESRKILKTFFETGDIPTQEQFGDVIDSYIHQQDDNVTIYLEPGTKDKRFGIGTTTPAAPLGIMATGADENIAAFNRAKEVDPKWFINLNSGAPGFNIEEVEPSGLVSRLFIQESNGYVGIGTTTPNEQLHIQNSTGAGVTGIRILNEATIVNQGFVIGHENNSVTGEDGSLSFYENTTTDSTKRLTLITGGNFGINELVPDTKLHVSADPAAAKTTVSLVEGSGIVTIGPLTNNLNIDFQGIQARTGTYIGTEIDLEVSPLNLQILGGDILIHGDSTVPAASKGIITVDARLGLGTTTPSEKVEIAGAIKIGTSLASGDGTIRYTGTDFEGHKAGAWVSLTGGSTPPPPAGPWTQGAGNLIYYLAGTDSRVGIGTNSALSTLDVNDGESVAGGNTGAIIYNHSQTTSTTPTDNRIGLQLFNNGVWGNPNALDIGLYISDVSGAASSESNIAAAMDGNIVIGSISSSPFLGAGASRVLSIQAGTDPAVTTGGTSSAQVYTKGLGPAAIPTLHVMRGNGEIVKLYTEAALTTADNTALTDSYTVVTEAVIDNLRTRLNELEARLQNIGLLA
ncbi:MAG: hypothetical protein ACXVPY_09210 [Bacteroidia bacterium]